MGSRAVPIAKAVGKICGAHWEVHWEGPAQPLGRPLGRGAGHWEKHWERAWKARWEDTHCLLGRLLGSGVKAIGHTLGMPDGKVFTIYREGQWSAVVKKALGKGNSLSVEIAGGLDQGV